MIRLRAARRPLPLRLTAWLTSIALAATQTLLPCVAGAAETQSPPPTGDHALTTTSEHPAGPSVQHFFTGQRSVPEAGLYDFGARYYDPEIGHFLSVDPILQNPGDPQALNAYSYVRNNPINVVDPTGEFFQFLIAALLTISAVATSTAISTGIGSLIASATGHEHAAQRLAKVSQMSAWVGTPVTFIEGGGMFVASAHFLASAANRAAEPSDPMGSAFSGPSFHAVQHTLTAVGQVGVGEMATSLLLGGVGAAARAAAPSVSGAVGPMLRRFAARYGPTLGEDIIPAGRRLSPYRIAGPDERFVRFEINPGLSKLTPSGGLAPDTYVAPASELPLARHAIYNRYQLPHPELPRGRMLYGIRAPGDLVVGPRPVSGGSGIEAHFPFGTRPGTVGGVRDISNVDELVE